jgi:malonyl-CoA/methylmalonyl-CoA synthetase
MLSQDNLLSNARTLVDAWGITAGDVLIHALPIFHTHGLFVAVNTLLLAGGAMIWLPRFDAEEVAGLMPRATMLMGVPTFYTRLLAAPAFTREAAQGVRLFVSGSAPLLAEVHRAFQARSGHAILERYGMTETGMNTSNPLHGERRPGTVGPALPGVEVRVTHAAGAPVEAGAVGGVEVRGPNVFKGYWRNPEKTAEELSPEGWFRTGDLGSLDGDGYLTIVGRAKDLIITGGLNVYPRRSRRRWTPCPVSPRAPSSACLTRTSARRWSPSWRGCRAMTPTPPRSSPASGTGLRRSSGRSR